MSVKDIQQKINVLNESLKSIEKCKKDINDEARYICHWIDNHDDIKRDFYQITLSLNRIYDRVSKHIKETQIFKYRIWVFYGRSKQELNRDFFIESNIDFDKDSDDINVFLEQLVADNIISEEDAEHVTDVYKWNY